MHATPQAEPLQVAEPFAGAGQGEQELPQKLTLALDTHMPLQLWKPAAQVPPQIELSEMQAPLHILNPAAQRPWHRPSEHTAKPLRGTGQGVHDCPQCSAELFVTHELPQRCVPDGQVKAEVVTSASPVSPSSPVHDAARAARDKIRTFIKAARIAGSFSRGEGLSSWPRSLE